MGLHAFLRPVVCPLAVTGLGFADPSSRIIGVTCGWGRLCLRGAVVSRQAALNDRLDCGTYRGTTCVPAVFTAAS